MSSRPEYENAGGSLFSLAQLRSRLSYSTREGGVVLRGCVDRGDCTIAMQFVTLRRFIRCVVDSGLRVRRGNLLKDQTRSFEA